MKSALVKPLYNLCWDGLARNRGERIDFCPQLAQKQEGLPDVTQEPFVNQKIGGGPPQQALSGGVFTIARSVGFDITRQKQSRPHHTGQHQVVSIAYDLMVRIAIRTTQWTTLAGAPSDSGSIHGQADAAAGFKSLVALGLAQYPRQSGPRASRI